ncbi:MAG: type II toxin-antitoxin system HipA family toxin [Verrucomicrobiota bacterium]|nr:type II toxin-antitoxin system HipA family toxin [Verrucomicrobiota bacterium]
MKKLSVHLSNHPGQDRPVGVLAESNRKIYFEYDIEFLKAPLWLSPFKLPPEPGLQEHRDLSFGPLFGLFDDSLPDGWGRLLMDRHFRQLGLPPETLSPLDRLAYMGTRGMGALSYHPPAPSIDRQADALDLHPLAQEAYRVLEGSAADVLPELLIAGGSPGGARPKVLVGVCGDKMISGADLLPAGYRAWIVKFHSKHDATEDGRIEYAYSKMAQAAGLDMPPTRLFTTPEGEAFFGVERFDRQDNQRIHTHTFGNLIHSNFRIPGCDYEQLIKTTRVLTKNQADVVAVFRQMVFNILAHNRDDHVKNFAFLLNSQNEWRLTPAYDLTFTHGPGGEHTMTVAGEGRSPQNKHIMQIADGAGISPGLAREIIAQATHALSDWESFADEAGLSKGTTRRIAKALLRVPSDDAFLDG